MDLHWLSLHPLTSVGTPRCPYPEISGCRGLWEIPHSRMLKALETWVFLFRPRYCLSFYLTSLGDVEESEQALLLMDGS